jgi:hypothetical protein
VNHAKSDPPQSQIWLKQIVLYTFVDCFLNVIHNIVQEQYIHFSFLQMAEECAGKFGGPRFSGVCK